MPALGADQPRADAKKLRSGLERSSSRNCHARQPRSARSPTRTPRRRAIERDRALALAARRPLLVQPSRHRTEQRGRPRSSGMRRRRAGLEDVYRRASRREASSSASTLDTVCSIDADGRDRRSCSCSRRRLDDEDVGAGMSPYLTHTVKLSLSLTARTTGIVATLTRRAPDHVRACSTTKRAFAAQATVVELIDDAERRAGRLQLLATRERDGDLDQDHVARR